MAASVKVKVNPRWTKELQAVAIASLLTRKALEVERQAKRLCPVDTGNLRRSIVSGIGVEFGEIVGICAATAPYAAYVEYGTSRTRPQPFLRPALQHIRKGA